MSPLERFPLAARSNVPLLGYQGGTVEEDCSHAQGLQYWAEKSNPPMPGQPCLLVQCILELQETMEQYVSFSDDTVLDGMAPPEGFFEDRAKITIPGESPPIFTNVPIEGVAMEEVAPLRGPLRNLLHPKCYMKSR